MKLLLTLSLILFTSIVSIGQETFLRINGKIIASESGEAMPYCSVYISGTAVGTITNAQGEFQLKISSEYKSDSLVISHLGYQNHYVQVSKLPSGLIISLKEAIVNLETVAIETKALTADDIFQKALERVNNSINYPTGEFRMDGFYREIHESENERTGVLECAIEIYDKRVTDDFKDIVIPHFRKTYDKQKNTDQFIESKEGHNHLLLLLNRNINLIPLANNTKNSIWGDVKFKIDKITYYNDRLVYILSHQTDRNELKLVIDLEDFTIYKNELILFADEEDHERYAWVKMNAKGEKCGAIKDHQSFEYRKIDGVLYPYYFFRRFEFRCYDLTKQQISEKAGFSTELLINNVQTEKLKEVKRDKLKIKQGLINRKEPYDSSFWEHFNDIKDITMDQKLVDEELNLHYSNEIIKPLDRPQITYDRPLRIGDHSLYDFTRADTLYGSASILYDNYDVHHYDLSVDIDPIDEIIAGVSKIRFKATDALDSLRIDLLEYIDIEHIQSNGIPLDYSRDFDAVYVKFPSTLRKDSGNSIEVSFTGHPLDIDFDIWAGGFIWQTDDSGLPFAQTLCQGYGPKGWWPAKNDLSDEPDSVDIHVSVPSTLFAVANGQLISQEHKNGKRDFHWKTKNPINNYNIAIHIGNYDHILSSYQTASGRELDVSHYFLQQDSVLAVDRLSMVPRMLDVYEKYFGEYPFVEDGFKMVQSPYPMEHQSCVAVGQYFDEQLILHETAHEWWGNSVSCTDNADIWIHEAFATYAESLYIEETLGYQLGQEYLNTRKNEIHNDHPIIGIEGVNHFHYRIEDKYFKGALVLNTLRHLINDDTLWFAMLKEIQKVYRHSSIDTDELLSYFTQELGAEYFIFFEQYLYTTNVPIMNIKPNRSGGYSYRFENVNEEFSMNLLIRNHSDLPVSSTWQETNIDLSSSQIVDLLQSRYLIKMQFI